MTKLNAIEKSKYINDRFKEYMKSSFEFGREDLQELFLEQLDEEELFKGPYVDVKFPFQRGANLETLIEEGIISKGFKKLKDVNFKRPLYYHQEEAIRHIGKGKSAIITTGTGSGKTESFIYPILNELLFDIEDGNNDVGIRAIFLYPMNALVNDQIERIRKILSNCPEITFGFFTGETPKTKGDIKDKDINTPENELLTREEIRENPPHILFTNYSMLEYLLIRPNDYAIFEKSRLNNWKYVVLDEAHSYRGSLGIELSMLMRRLTGLAEKKPQFILTSATLGEKGRSENEIVRFAKNLTSINFNVDDIIFAKRIELKEKYKYRMVGKEYTNLKANLDSIEEVKKTYKKYYDKNNRDSVEEMLYELLLRDRNVHELSDLLTSGSKTFKELYEELRNHISESELIDLIDIINIAEKNGIGIFELKYHSFVRPLSGAYITFGKDTKISLTKTNEIDGMKAFELGNCRFCKSPYIIGKIQKNDSDGKEYLLQNDEVDIYENYGDKKFVKLDYFLLDSKINEDEVESSKLETNELCTKCGEIHPKDNLNANKCECGESFRIEVYKVNCNNKKKTVYNNIIECPSCGRKGKSGVVKAFNIGKDEGTALIGQILYEAIDEDENSDESISTNEKKIIIGRSKKNKVKEKKVKQYLAFSDSRQQASFAAAFFENNHERMLRRRLIWEVIKEHNYEEMSVDKLASCLANKIKNNKLFDNKLNAEKNAWVTLLVDLLRVDGSYDSEGLGLYYFDLDIREIFENVDEEMIKKEFSKYGCEMNAKELYELIQIVTKVFKTTPAIDYSDSGLTKEDKENFLVYRCYDNHVTLEAPKGSSSEKKIKSFLPIGNRDNMIVRYVEKVFGCDRNLAKEVLKIIFDLLEQLDEVLNGELLVKNNEKEAYKIKAGRYILKNYKKEKIYKCDRCGSITPHNVRNKCPKDKCEGTLIEIDPDEELKNNFYRREYKNKKIESIVIEEHTAQIERKEAKQYQDDFKNKKINILSCSTTFEMGIDIGGLETVFMRNVPPTPANYVQRAGRAGRRKGSSAYIITYCDASSHDYTYFSEPEKMISGIINPPYFNIINRKIITRHLMATSLGAFFRAYNEYYNNIDVFLEEGIDKFNGYIKSKPVALGRYIDEKIIPEEGYKEYHDFAWFKENDKKLSYFVDTLSNNMKELDDAIFVSKETGEYDAAARYSEQRENLKKKSLVEYLSIYCVIPKYGFPVDVVDLKLYEDGVPINEYELTRDLKTAISEYAPDSEVMVDKKKYVSKYITLNKKAEFPKNYFVTCEKCKKINVFLSEKNTLRCKYCNGEISNRNIEFYIEPENGFKGVEAKESTHLKPKRSYSGEVIYIGGGEQDGNELVIKNKIKVKTSSDDQLLIMNKSEFYMCPVCGYSEIEKGKRRREKITRKHKNYMQFECKNSTLNYIRLGHKFETDVARFIIPELSFNEKISHQRAISFLYAFLEGISIAMGIERNDIDGVLEPNIDNESYDIILYDNVPGGAGHVKRLLNEESVKKSLEAALEKVSKKCCDENTSCYNCLRNYNNQLYHSRLKRKYAIEVIEELLETINNKEELCSDKNVKEKNTMNLKLGSDGINPGTESAKEIWEYLLEDCYSDTEIKIINELKEKTKENISRPYHSVSVTIEETEEVVKTSLIWYEKKVILFLDDLYDDYKISKKTGWDVYCTKEGFDISELLEKVGE